MGEYPLASQAVRQRGLKCGTFFRHTDDIDPWIAQIEWQMRDLRHHAAAKEANSDAFISHPAYALTWPIAVATSVPTIDPLSIIRITPQPAWF